MKNLFNSTVAEIQMSYKNLVPAADRRKVTSSRDAYEILKDIWEDDSEYIERFYILVLNKANKCLGYRLISQGGTSGCVVDLKLIFQTALKCNASSIILSHNHPSGNIHPSEADSKITRKCKDAGLLMDLAVLDHIIIGGESYYSFADEGNL